MQFFNVAAQAANLAQQIRGVAEMIVELRFDFLQLVAQVEQHRRFDLLKTDGLGSVADVPIYIFPAGAHREPFEVENSPAGGGGKTVAAVKQSGFRPPEIGFTIVDLRFTIAVMNPQLLEILERDFSGTLADLRIAAEKEFNGTKFSAIKRSDGNRIIIAACFTGAHEISKAMKNIKAEDIEECDFSRTGLSEAVAAALLNKTFLCLRSNSTPTALVLISADPDSTTKVEFLLGLKP